MQIREVRDWLSALAMIGSALHGLGCGSIDNKQHPADASSDSPPAAPPDAPPGPPCDPKKPFGTPTLVPNINGSAADQGARFVDELTLYLGSARTPSPGLYVATRSSPTAAFGTPAPLAAINAQGAALGPTLTGDGLTMYYTQSTSGTGDIYVTRRADKTKAFPAGTPVAEVNVAGVDDLDPFITADGTTLYFGSARGATQLNLYVATLGSNGKFGTPQALTSLNTTSADSHPVLTHDGLQLYWSSPRSDGGALGGTDVWTTTRPSTSASFDGKSPVVRVPELSTASDESLSWISDDGCMVLLQSNRPGGLGAQDIYQAVRPR